MLKRNSLKKILRLVPIICLAIITSALIFIIIIKVTLPSFVSVSDNYPLSNIKYAIYIQNGLDELHSRLSNFKDDETIAPYTEFFNKKNISDISNVFYIKSKKDADISLLKTYSSFPNIALYLKYILYGKNLSGTIGNFNYSYAGRINYGLLLKLTSPKLNKSFLIYVLIDGYVIFKNDNLSYDIINYLSNKDVQGTRKQNRSLLSEMPKGLDGFILNNNASPPPAGQKQKVSILSYLFDTARDFIFNAPVYFKITNYGMEFHIRNTPSSYFNTNGSPDVSYRVYNKNAFLSASLGVDIRKMYEDILSEEGNDNPESKTFTDSFPSKINIYCYAPPPDSSSFKFKLPIIMIDMGTKKPDKFKEFILKTLNEVKDISTGFSDTYPKTSSITTEEIKNKVYFKISDTDSDLGKGFQPGLLLTNNSVVFSSYHPSFDNMKFNRITDLDDDDSQSISNVLTLDTEFEPLSKIIKDFSLYIAENIVSYKLKKNAYNKAIEKLKIKYSHKKNLQILDELIKSKLVKNMDHNKNLKTKYNDLKDKLLKEELMNMQAQIFKERKHFPSYNADITEFSHKIDLFINNISSYVTRIYFAQSSDNYSIIRVYLK